MTQTPSRDIYSVTRLNTEVKMVLEGSFPLLWVEGEISNLARPASGHWYLSLKDSGAQVSCAMFRNRNANLKFKPENGQKVLVRARISLFEARGNYQLILDHMEPAGDGALQRAYEALKHKLDQEGLFAKEHKKTLPYFPKRIGIVTSDTSAAVRDVLSVLKRRFASIPVRIYPVPVQGDRAAPMIVRAINNASLRQDCDVLIVTRGGGSLEDLQAFNEESVARAIADCEIPVISAVGHEIDFTIADFVADVRAPTPSAAAERAVPDSQDLQRQFQSFQARLNHLIRHHQQSANTDYQYLLSRLHNQHPKYRIDTDNQRLDELSMHLSRVITQKLLQQNQRLNFLSQRFQHQHPKQLLQTYQERLNNVQRRLNAPIQTKLNGVIATLSHVQKRLHTRSPRDPINQAKTHLEDLQNRLKLKGQHIVQTRQLQLHSLSRSLNAVSPLATLERGYAIAKDKHSGAVLQDSAHIAVHDEVEITLAKGSIECRVSKIS